jgi:hypothetical protein
VFGLGLYRVRAAPPQWEIGPPHQQDRKIVRWCGSQSLDFPTAAHEDHSCAARHHVQVDRVAPLPADIHRWRGLRLAVPQHNPHRHRLPPMSPGPRLPADGVTHETVAAARDRGPPTRRSTDQPTPIPRQCQGARPPTRQPDTPRTRDELPRRPGPSTARRRISSTPGSVPPPWGQPCSPVAPSGARSVTGSSTGQGRSTRRNLTCSGRQ